jgi:hypothetical protein
MLNRKDTPTLSLETVSSSLDELPALLFRAILRSVGAFLFESYALSEVAQNANGRAKNLFLFLPSFLRGFIDDH